jgi:hypothetical protein
MNEVHLHSSETFLICAHDPGVCQCRARLPFGHGLEGHHSHAHCGHGVCCQRQRRLGPHCTRSWEQHLQFATLTYISSHTLTNYQLCCALCVFVIILYRIVLLAGAEPCFLPRQLQHLGTQSLSESPQYQLLHRENERQLLRSKQRQQLCDLYPWVAWVTCMVASSTAFDNESTPCLCNVDNRHERCRVDISRLLLYLHRVRDGWQVVLRCGTRLVRKHKPGRLLWL